MSPSGDWTLVERRRRQKPAAPSQLQLHVVQERQALVTTRTARLVARRSAKLKARQLQEDNLRADKEDELHLELEVRVGVGVNPSGWFTERTSRPAQKARPSPCTTTARTLLSAASSRAAPAMDRNISISRLLSLSARFSFTVTTPLVPLSICTRCVAPEAQRMPSTRASRRTPSARPGCRAIIDQARG